MTYFTSWEEFAKAVEKLYGASPDKCRFVTKYRHKDGKLVLKMTDDTVCLQYTTDQAQDVKKMEKLTSNLMRHMVTKDYGK
uniref:Signal recognition particle 9 kDa protein n=1 Tax=Romanomermis culicivorax TaxID=13658 RepID=A0A915L853_ROMCU